MPNELYCFLMFFSIIYLKMKKKTAIFPLREDCEAQLIIQLKSTPRVIVSLNIPFPISTVATSNFMDFFQISNVTISSLLLEEDLTFCFPGQVRRYHALYKPSLEHYMLITLLTLCQDEDCTIWYFWQLPDPCTCYSAKHLPERGKKLKIYSNNNRYLLTSRLPLNMLRDAYILVKQSELIFF